MNKFLYSLSRTISYIAMIAIGTSIVCSSVVNIKDSCKKLLKGKKVSLKKLGKPKKVVEEKKD